LVSFSSLSVNFLTVTKTYGWYGDSPYLIISDLSSIYFSSIRCFTQFQLYLCSRYSTVDMREKKTFAKTKNTLFFSSYYVSNLIQNIINQLVLFLSFELSSHTYLICPTHFELLLNVCRTRYGNKSSSIFMVHNCSRSFMD
jgi:hypothetical protein